MIDIVEYAIECSNVGRTKLNEKAKNLEGMSSFKVRNLLNKLLELDNSKYLEIGVWKGSTLYSALCGNNPKYSVAIDNWSLFGGPKNEFLKNMEEYKLNYQFYDVDCFSIDKTLFKNKFNIYFYDGEHESIDQEKALTYYIDCLEDKFIYVCDDWNFKKVEIGTRLGIEKTNIKIEKEWVLPADYNGDLKNWWNGLYVAVCSK
jgi:hypothetical protein